jgi:hypothetical protein
MSSSVKGTGNCLERFPTAKVILGFSGLSRKGRCVAEEEEEEKQESAACIAESRISSGLKLLLAGG